MQADAAIGRGGGGPERRKLEYGDRELAAMAAFPASTRKIPSLPMEMANIAATPDQHINLPCTGRMCNSASGSFAVAPFCFCWA